MKISALFLVIISVFSGIIAAMAPVRGTINDVPVYGYKVVNVYPHDPKAFTEGLIFKDGFLYEGTGLYGRSELRKVELVTGKVLCSYRLPRQYFGEGITIFRNEIIQLTWRERKGFVFEKETCHPIREFSYPSDGWGLTNDDKRLIMSDGSASLYFIDPQTFKHTGSIEVSDNGVPVKKLNELEYIKGKIYANVWPTDRIAIISPETGVVEAWIELSGLGKTELPSRKAVLNGIAYDSERDRLFVTGKFWPKLFEIELIRAR